ncbi:MAG TPA: cytochrome c3 family protein [Chloroflexota bacterium]
MSRPALIALTLGLLLVPAALLSGLVFVVTVGAPWLLNSQVGRVPREPILFDHSLHTRVVGLDCAFCHRTASKGATAGYPELEQCMFCHEVIGQGASEIEKVRVAWTDQQPINWERVHRMPDHVHFVHDAHIRAGFECATCHGDVQQMSQVVQVRRLNMSDCVDCHRQNQAPTECITCHH